VLDYCKNYPMRVMPFSDLRPSTSFEATNKFVSLFHQPTSAFTMSNDPDEDGDRQQGDYNRPRRPNPDTISYLRSLPLDVQVSNDEVAAFLSSTEQDPEYPQSLSAALSAIDEIRNEIASLAGEEYGSQCIEVMATIALPYSEFAARTMMFGLTGYHLHLATHRYGSHVVQTILQLAVVSKTEKDMAVHEDGPQLTQEDLPSLTELILGMVEELTPHAGQLAVHVCGSHVMRSLLCLLGGVDLQQGPAGSENKLEGGAVRRGKNKNKKKKKPEGAQNNEQAHAGMMQMNFKAGSRIEASQLSDCLVQLSDALWGANSGGPGELQQIACHPSAGPLLIVSLRVLTYAFVPSKEDWLRQESDPNKIIADFRLGIHKQEPIYEVDSPAGRLACSVLCLNLDETDEKQVGDVIYGLSGEPRGSHVLETLFRISPDSIYEKILEYGGFVASLQDYSEHFVSNFVIQALLTTVRTKEQAELLLKSVEKVVVNGYVVDKQNRRRGILWRAAEMAAKFRVGQESLLKSLRIGMGIVTGKGREEEEDDDGRIDEEGKKKKKRQKASSIPLKDCIPPLIDLKGPDREGGRVIIEVEGTRAVYHFLRFSPRLCDEVLGGVIKCMSHDDLELIAKDGLGSRCIMDGILDGPMNEEVFAKAAKNLLQKLSGRWVALASDRVGHHSVKKLFKSLPSVDDKAELAAELAQGINRLGGSSMGRSVMEACALDKFLEGEKPWKDAMKKLQEKDKWLNEIIEGEVDDGGKKKRKRKRKKDDQGNEEDSNEPKKSNDDVGGIMARISSGAP
jgi:nucleolar protein 9